MKKNTDLMEQLRADSAKLVNAFDRADEIRAKIKTFDADAAAKCAKLDAEIQDLDRRADGCDESAVAQLAIKQETRKRLATKLDLDRKARVAELETEARRCFDGVTTVDEIISNGRSYYRQHVMDFMLTIFENEAAANGATGSCHAVQAMERWPSLRASLIVGDQEFIQRLRSFADGSKPLYRI